VRDQQNRECLNVRFLNPKAVKVLGVFEFPTAKLPAIVIDQDKVVSIAGTIYSNGCAGEGEGFSGSNLGPRRRDVENVPPCPMMPRQDKEFQIRTSTPWKPGLDLRTLIGLTFRP
jgi:hypothetical protein